MKKYLALGLAALLAIGATIVPDSYDKLFCRMNGTTTTFVDSSSPAKTITANGNATQLPIKFNKSAGFFNGTSDYVQVPDDAEWDLTGNFTVEWFENRTALTLGKHIIARDATTDPTPWVFGYSDGTYNKVFISSNGSSYDIASDKSMGTIDLNTWNHFAITRNGNNFYTFKNGTQVSTWSSASFPLARTTALSIAKWGATYYSGWIKELRISKVDRSNSGASFTVPTAQYHSDSDTVLLMHFDTPATSPLGPAIAFDGTGDYLEVAHSADWTPSTGFTVEAWIKFSTVGNCIIAEQMGTVGNYGWYLQYDTGYFKFGVSYDGTNQVVSTLLKTPVADVWYHLIGSKDGNTLSVWLGGNVVGTTTGDFTSKTPYDSTSAVHIGASFLTGSISQVFNGSMREIRISNVARYTTVFTPSQSGFTVDANTVLYIKGDEDNGVTTFVDSETTPKTVTTAGDTKIKYTEDYRSCIFKDETGKFPYPVGSAKVDFFAIGSGVGYFDGNGDYLSIPTSTDFDFSNGALTMEFYARHSSVADTGQGYFFKGANNGNTGFSLVWNGAGVIAFYANGNTEVVTSTTYSPLINTWMHIAVSRTSNTWDIFVNGTLLVTASSSVTIADDANELKIGHGATFGGAPLDWAYDASTYQFIGLLDNIRISKGVARYTATFNPPDDYSAPRIGKRKTNWFFFF